jgi:creatinine amidohydrolase
MPFSFWADLNHTAFRDSALADAVAIVPVGAIEQHGPHLPLSTDAVLAEEMAREIASRVVDARVLVLPAVAYGKSDEHLGYQGTVSLDAETLIAILNQIGRSIARAGVRRVVFLNAHGGNVPVLQIVIRRLRVELGLFCVAAGWVSMGFPEGVVSPREAQEGIHGGLVETAAMLHFRPDLVDMSKARHFVPASAEVARSNEVLRLMGPVSAGWSIEDLHADGAAGDASAATPEIGARIVEHAAIRYARLIEEVARHDLPRTTGPA